MSDDRPYSPLIEKLRTARLRPTRQRLSLAKILFGQGDRHVTAEELYEEAQSAKVPVSLATIYNTLHQFTHAGLLREVVIESGRSYFDTNVSNHHHFYLVEDGRLLDIPGMDIALQKLPQPPMDAEIDRVDVIVRLVKRTKDDPARS